MASVLVNQKMLRDDRLLNLVENSGRGRAEVIGILALFWMKTRAAGLEQIQGDGPELERYLPVPPDRASELASKMIWAGYLTALEGQEGRYAIVDNQGVAEKLAKVKARMSKAGKASAAKRSKKAPASKPKDRALAIPEPSVNYLTWAAYVDAYRARYSHEPVRNAKTNSLVAMFTKRIPQQEAPAVLAFYVRHNDMRYVHKLHPIDFALKDAEALYTQYKSGRVVTYAEAKAAERVANPMLPNERTLEVRGQLEAIRRGDI